MRRRSLWVKLGAALGGRLVSDGDASAKLFRSDDGPRSGCLGGKGPFRVVGLCWLPHEWADGGWIVFDVRSPREEVGAVLGALLSYFFFFFFFLPTFLCVPPVDRMVGGKSEVVAIGV